jgi:serine/threonine-protein kinase HipA
MIMGRCLYCYNDLGEETYEFHPSCSRKIFGTPIPPDLPYSDDDMLQLAGKIIKSQSTVTGVQPKLSLHIEKLSKKDEPQRFTIVGLWGGYILKPPTKQYKFIPELEDVTMHLAEISGIEVVPHSLIRLRSGNLSYITKRIDRRNELKIHMEDMCQLTERLTEQKYQGSHEQIAKAILKYSANPVLDVTKFFEQVLFSFLTGNADMHLKNFSLIDNSDMGYILSPAYDMVASALVVIGDTEELALTLNGKKKKFRKKDFVEVMARFHIGNKAIENIFNRFKASLDDWYKFIDISFLPDDMKTDYHDLIVKRASQINMTDS